MIEMVAAIGLAALLLHILGIGCPIKFMFGISCPGCGMTRACLSAIHFDFAEAFSFHPLFWVIPCYIIGYCFREKIPKKVINILNIIVIIAFISVYFIRMFYVKGEIVVFSPGEGLIYRVIEIILSLFNIGGK